MCSDNPIFLGSEIESCPMERALFSVLPVPFEKSVSYAGGTGSGPLAILKASWQLETWDGQSSPCENGIHTCDAVDCKGDASLVIERISLAVTNILQAGSMPVILGGEHTVTYGSIKGILNSGIKNFGVVQIDAHADLREAYEGNDLSHASVMKRVVDMNIPIYQLGVRALCDEEIAARQSPLIYYRDAEELVKQNVNSIQLPEAFPEKVFFTVDVDGLDPSVFPSTGTPVPGGLGWYQALSLFESVAKQRQIIGFDVVEHAPIPGFHAYDFAASLLVYKLMGIVERTR